MGRPIQGLQHLHITLALCQELGDTVREAFTLDNIGNVYSHLGDYPNALTYYSRAASLPETLQNDHRRANSLNNIGHTLYKIDDHKEALGYLYESLAVAETMQDKHIFREHPEQLSARLPRATSV